MSAMSEFLKDVRILDLSQYIPGPLGSLLLVDLGAEVIKVEPLAGDPMRTLGPRTRSDGPLFYETLNAGKSVVHLNLKDPDDVSAFIELVKSADVVIEGFRPGVMQRLGIDYATLSLHNPKLIYCAISGYGASGIDALKAGHDANYLAEAGVLDRNGNDGPMYFDPPIADEAGSLYAAIAILGALNARHRTGVGCEIDIALADVIMPMQLLQIADYGENAAVPSRRGTYLNGGAAYYNVYQTIDGRHIVVGAVEPKFWQAFCQAAGKERWIARQNEPIPQHPLISDVATRIGEFTLAQCETRFAQGDCCVSTVLPLDEALEAARTRERGLVTRGDNGLQALFPALVNGRPPSARPPLKPFTQTI
jgi:alpha-methylacyl-CoA racemase